MASLHRVNDAAGFIRFLDGQEFALPVRRNEGQHHHVGIGIQEDVLDECFRPTKSDSSQAILTDKMPLHIEDELTTFKALGGLVGVKGGHLGQAEKPACAPCCSVGPVEREQRGCRTGRSDHERAPRETKAPSVLTGPLMGQAVGAAADGVQRYRHELAIGRGIDFDRQSCAIGVVPKFHADLLRPSKSQFTLRAPSNCGQITL